MFDGRGVTDLNNAEPVTDERLFHGNPDVLVMFAPFIWRKTPGSPIKAFTGGSKTSANLLAWSVTLRLVGIILIGHSAGAAVKVPVLSTPTKMKRFQI
jgi:hypothetical protein